MPSPCTTDHGRRRARSMCTVHGEASGDGLSPSSIGSDWSMYRLTAKRASAPRVRKRLWARAVMGWDHGPRAVRPNVSHGLHLYTTLHSIAPPPLLPCWLHASVTPRVRTAYCQPSQGSVLSTASTCSRAAPRAWGTQRPLAPSCCHRKQVACLDFRLHQLCLFHVGSWSISRHIAPAHDLHVWRQTAWDYRLCLKLALFVRGLADKRRTASLDPCSQRKPCSQDFPL